MRTNDVIRRARQLFSQSPTASVRAALDEAAVNHQIAEEAERHLDRYASLLSDCDTMDDIVRIEGRAKMLAIFDIASS